MGWINVEAVKCNELIKSWTDITDDEKDEMYNELFEDNWYCPNTTSLKLQGDLLIGFFNFFVFIKPPHNSISDEFIKNTYVLTTTLSRYFDIKNYNKKGYQKVFPGYLFIKEFEWKF